MALPSNSAQPKIVQKLLKRTAFFLIVLAILFGVFRWVQAKGGDYDSGGESKGMMAAIRMEPEGQQAVLIGPDGTVKGTKSWKSGVTDREPVWSPDGRYLFFCSDREDATFNVFRWNPQKDDAESRTIGHTSRSAPTFAPDDTGETMLVVAGGNVRELEPKTKKSPQVLPPTNAEIAQSGEGDESGTEGAFAAIYGDLGKSFRLARYLPGRRYIAAVMRRDEGEVFVIQDLQDVGGKLPKPQALAAGDRIDFDVDPKGQVVFSVQNFRWPDPKAVPEGFRRNNRITTPFRNMVALVDPAAKTQVVVAASADDKNGFGSPRLAPDGSRFLLVAGAVREGALDPAALLTVPARPQGISQASVLTRGDVHEPSWSADGTKIAYAKRAGGKRDLFTMGSDGTNETNLTKGQGDFATPLFSPMK